MQHHFATPDTGFPLDVDLTDLILTTLSDIHSLESLVLSSKFIYNVFDARRASVLRAVVSNHLGSAAPPATRLLKVLTDVDTYWRGWLSPLPVAKLPREQDSDLGPILTLREARILAANHDVVQTFESLYSWRKKDPRSPSSRLTLNESERFQAALYRVWFVCALYGRPAPAYRVAKSKSKRLGEIQKDLGQEQAKFLQSLSQTELPSLLQAWSFMLDLATWAVRAEFLPQKNYSSLEAYLAWSGPRMTLQAFQGKLTVVDRKVVPSLCASYEQFCAVFNAAGFRQQSTTESLISPNECFLDALECQQCSCAAVGGMWSESNWYYLRGIVPPSEFFNFLELPWWNSYTDADALKEICHTTPYSQIVGETFTLRLKAYKGWKSRHWLCTTCLQTFLRDNIEAYCLSRRNPGQVEQ